MRTKYCITFAGAAGSSKTPIAHYLSWNLGLPVHNNDAVRTEVSEDLLKFDQEEYLSRRDARNAKIRELGRPFIYDASVDREWERMVPFWTEHGYEIFVISLGLSRELLGQIYKAKRYREAELERFVADHSAFLDSHGPSIGVHISDADFPRRLEISLEAVTLWLERDE